MRDKTQTKHDSGVLTCWCEFCGDGFRTNYRRNAHIEQQHEEVLPECPTQPDEEN